MSSVGTYLVIDGVGHCNECAKFKFGDKSLQSLRKTKLIFDGLNIVYYKAYFNILLYKYLYYYLEFLLLFVNGRLNSLKMF